MTLLKKGRRPTFDGRTRAKKRHFWGADPTSSADFEFFQGSHGCISMSQVTKCPYCNMLNVKPYAARIREHYPHCLRVVCQDCGLIFAYPQATPEELETFYKNYYDKGNFQGWKESVQQWKVDCDADRLPSEHQEVNRVASRLFNAVSKDTRGLHWLEIGAGLGQLSYLAKGKGFDVAVTDLDNDAIDFMRTVMEIHQAYLGDITSLPLPGEKYDIVVIHHVLEHVTCLFSTLRAIYRVLRPGGLVFVGVPNMSSSGYKFYRVASFLTFKIPGIVDGMEHTFGFTPQTLRQCLQKEGFHVQSIRTFGEGNNLASVLSTRREKGLKKAAVALAQSIFHIKIECIAAKPPVAQ